MEKYGSIDPRWTPAEKDQDDELVKQSDDISNLEEHTTKRLSDEVNQRLNKKRDSE